MTLSRRETKKDSGGIVHILCSVRSSSYKLFSKRLGSSVKEQVLVSQTNFDNFLSHPTIQVTLITSSVAISQVVLVDRQVLTLLISTLQRVWDFSPIH